MNGITQRSGLQEIIDAASDQIWREQGNARGVLLLASRSM